MSIEDNPTNPHDYRVEPPKYMNGDHATLEAKIRLDAIENTVREIKKVAEEARLLAQRQQDRIEGMVDWQTRQNGSIADMVKAFNALSTTVNIKLEDIKDRLIVYNSTHQDDLAKVCGEYDTKIEKLNINLVKQSSNDRDKFQRWLIAIMGTIIAGLFITIVSIRFGF